MNSTSTIRYKFWETKMCGFYDQTRPDQDTKNFNLAELILELSFLFRFLVSELSCVGRKQSSAEPEL